MALTDTFSGCSNGGFWPCEGLDFMRISGAQLEKHFMCSFFCIISHLGASTALNSRVWTLIMVNLHFEV